MSLVRRFERWWLLLPVGLLAPACPGTPSVAVPAPQVDAAEPVFPGAVTPESSGSVGESATGDAGCPPERPLRCAIRGGGTLCGTPAECEAVREPECDEPADCAARAACVVNALGGPVGCTGEACCGASECVNGCRSDADCPACRPVCGRGEGRETGSCRNPTGP